MKTISTLLLLAWFVPGATAQPTPAQPAPGAASAAAREEKLRRALDEAYAQVANTNPAAGPTNLSPEAAKLPLTLTNRVNRVTNAPAAPGDTLPGTTVVLNPDANATNLPAVGAAQPRRPFPLQPGAPARAATNVVRPPTRPGPPAFPAAQVPAAAVPPATSPASSETPLPKIPAPPGAGTFTATGTNSADNAQEDIILEPGMIRFQETDLFQVLDLYQELTGRTVMRPANLPGQKITIRSQTPLTRREAVQALDSILSLNGVVMIPQGEKFVKALSAAEAGTGAGAFNKVPHDDLPNSGSLVTHVVQLKNALPKDVIAALEPFSKLPKSIIGLDNSGILILRDYSENVKRMLEILDKIDIAERAEYEPVVIPIKYALAGDIAQVLSSLTAGGGGATTVGAQQTRTGLSTSTGSRTGVGGAAGGLGNTGYPGQQQGYNPQGAAAGGLGSQSATRSSFQQRLQSIVNRASGGDIVVLSNVKIIADERTNSLLIFASKADIETIKDIIAKLDVVLAQVVIEALIFQISLNDALEYGVSYLQRNPNRSGNFSGRGAILNSPPGVPPTDLTMLSTNAGASGLTYFTRWGDFNAAVSAVASDGRVKVLSRPRIQTSHAVEANLFVGETRPYPTGTTYGGFGGNYSSIQQLQIGITLSVLPLINPDGLVVMDIRQKVQNIGDEVFIENIGNVPSTFDREANAKVAVRDRETVMLGGFITTEKRDTKSGVPFLKDIPLLGNLFRSTSKKENRAELMILIRPTVLPTPEAASELAMEEKSKMPGIAETERDMTKDERKQQEKAAKELMKREGFSQ